MTHHKRLVSADTDWARNAACARSSVDMFPTDELGRDHALAVCAVCPVTGPCLDYALVNGIDHGVWGGLTERERRAVRRKAAG